jgi:hypothetical protein
MHQTLTGTKKTQKNKGSNNYSEGLRSGPIVPGFFFGACEGLVTLTSQNIDMQKKTNH